MAIATMISIGSLFFGLLSAIFWVLSAVAKAPPPPDLEGKPDGSYWGGNVLNGGDLFGTLRAQARWNSRAAFAASAAVLLQIASGFFSD